ncbi:hypothetical protein [Streptomyces tendae]|uniref:hypothetical protein n=1 Tax=Streptomyces tendae TaxID=1932 RepID=UPI0036AF5C02
MTTRTAAGQPPTDHTASGAFRLLLTLCGLTALLLTSAAILAATPARAADGLAASRPPTRAAYLADRPSANPVHITDQLPREIPRSMAPDFARHELRGRKLTLPGPAGTRVPYDESEGSPLWVLGDGISRLASAVRESSHMH